VARDFIRGSSKPSSRAASTEGAWRPGFPRAQRLSSHRPREGHLGELRHRRRVPRDLQSPFR
jgi:hypothetical protein